MRCRLQPKAQSEAYRNSPKKLVTGKLREVAIQKIDDQTEALVSMIGDNQVDYRFFLGFKLMVTEDEVNLKNIKKSVFLTFREFLNEVRHTLMNDFVSMSNDEINRYVKMEKLLENKISRRFKIRRLEAKDFAYLMEHLYGRDGIAYEDYVYPLPKRKLKRETLIKYYDLIRPTRCVVEESQRYLRLEHEDSESYVSYFTVNAETVFAKPVNQFGGEGITKETVTPDTDYEALYKRLCDNKQYLVEETIKQNEQMDRLSPSSINTIRMVTLLHEGKAHFMYALVRMSNGTNCVDNICSGGMYVSIGADGVIHKNAYCDATGVYYEEHPFTHTKFNGFEIPMFFEAVEMCKKAALVVPQVGYIGWDVAITPTRPVLVEGNTLPSYDMCQNYGHIDNKTGVKPRFVEILGEEYFK